MNAVAQAATPDVNEVPAPLVFTDSAADKVKQLIEEEAQPGVEVARIRARRRVLGLPVRFHL